MIRRLVSMPLRTAQVRRYPVLRRKRVHDTAVACLWLLVAGALAVAAGVTEVTDDRGYDTVWFYAATFFMVTFFTLLSQLLRRVGLRWWVQTAIVLTVGAGFAGTVYSMAPYSPFAAPPPWVEIIGAGSILVAVAGLAAYGPWRRRSPHWLR